MTKLFLIVAIVLIISVVFSYAAFRYLSYCDEDNYLSFCDKDSRPSE